MVRKRRETTTTLTTVEFEAGTGSEAMVVSEPLSLTELELAVQKLRQRWELASVLNFINVFEPVIGSTLKISAEEIEMALIKPNSLLAKLHVTLLKGTLPVSKTLDGSDTWVSVLCKKLYLWWPWVAEGDFPLVLAKGEEMSRYRELDPTTRLLMLKALCEIRADQDDIASYINDAIKNGSSISTFRKDKIGGDGNGISYWYDGDPTIGHRLYKEVNKFDPKRKVTGKETTSAFNCHWETLATNFDEFCKIADELSSSKVKMEVAVGKALETDAIPALEKVRKKKERALKQQQRQQMLLNGFRNSGITCSGRNRKSISYTFDEYDRAIKDAIQIMETKKTTEEPRHEKDQNKHGKPNKVLLNSCFDPYTNSRDSESTETESGCDRQGNEVDDNSNYEYNVKKDDANTREGSDSSNSEKDGNNHCKWNQGMVNSQNSNGNSICKSKGLHGNRGLARNGKQNLPARRKPGAMNRLRQRPTRNTAIESVIVSDSEDENSSENIGNHTRGCENSSLAADADEDIDG